MSISVTSSQVTTGGVLKIGLSITSPSNYYIRTVWVTCNGANAYYLVPRKNYYTLTILNISSGVVTADIPLDLWPNGNITFTVHADHRLGTNANTISTDTTVDVPVTNTFFKPLGAYLPAAYPDSTIQEPVILSFYVPAEVTGGSIPVTLSVEDNVSVTGYLITESPTAPSLVDPNWSATPPTSYSTLNEGSLTLYAWAKDSDGNLSQPISRQTNFTLRLISSEGMTCSTSFVIPDFVQAPGIFAAVSFHSDVSFTAPALTQIANGVLAAENDSCSVQLSAPELVQVVGSLAAEDMFVATTLTVPAITEVISPVLVTEQMTTAPVFTIPIITISPSRSPSYDIRNINGFQVEIYRLSGERWL